jgi:hypothetical protein
MGWTSMELAEVLASNPHVRISRASDSAHNRPVADSKPERTIPRKSDLDENEAAKLVKAAPHNPKTDYKSMLVQQCELIGLKMEPEFKFHPSRRFRADWRVHFGMWEGKRPKKITHFIASPVLVEYEGGIFSSGKRGHSSIAGIQRDMEKSNLAQIAGYTVIRVTPAHVVSGEAVKWIMDALRREVICNCGFRQPVPPNESPF